MVNCQSVWPKILAPFPFVPSCLRVSPSFRMVELLDDPSQTHPMSSVQEIEAALADLSPKELRQVVRRADELFRASKGAAIYDDLYGAVSDADLIVDADKAFVLYDKEEAGSHDRAKG